MKKIGLLFLSIIWITCGCTPEQENFSSEIISETVQLSIPLKDSAKDNAVLSSPINVRNLDQYMFREDVQYVDLRNLNMVIQEGYVCGFQFIPFYQIIASFSSTSTLFTMKNKTNEDGSKIYSGQIGSFNPNYEESIEQLEYYFNKDKTIFFISQGGSEASYVMNLLIQIGYDGNKLYNVGGVSNNEGMIAYKNVSSNKYFVQPGINDISITFDIRFIDELTPIN